MREKSSLLKLVQSRASVRIDIKLGHLRGLGQLQNTPIEIPFQKSDWDRPSYDNKEPKMKSEKACIRRSTSAKVSDTVLNYMLDVPLFENLFVGM